MVRQRKNRRVSRGSDGARRTKRNAYILPIAIMKDPGPKLRTGAAAIPLPDGTLGDIGLATRVAGPREFPPVLLIQPYEPEATAGVDAVSLRMFRWDEGARSFRLVGHSGVNTGERFVWAEVYRSGVYVPIGFPRDRLLGAAIRSMARDRNLLNSDSKKDHEALTQRALAPFVEAPAEELAEVRTFLAMAEAQTTTAAIPPEQMRFGRGGHQAPFPLPKDATVEKFRERVRRIRTPSGGLPEEALVPLGGDGVDRPWPLPPGPFPRPWEWFPPRLLLRWDLYLWFRPYSWWFCFLSSRNWWMYHHDENHTGVASGCSGIRQTTVGGLHDVLTLGVNGTVVSIPTVVDGIVYVGTTNASGGIGGKLYRINLSTWGSTSYDVPIRNPAYSQGIGGSPAVFGGKVYFTAVPGWVYCLDAATLALLWVTDLRNASQAMNQPVQNDPWTDCWSSPLVVNGKVYVGCGEGEVPGTYGFVYCLDATNGHVAWLYCTCKFTNRLAPGSENAQNTIPASVAVSDPLPGWATAAGYAIQPDPAGTRETGCSVWSSCAYDAALNRIYVGTGNSQYKSGEPSMGADLPDEWYGSGLLALDATTGAFQGFFQPAPSDSYRPTDGDVDVPGSPTIFTRSGTRVVGFGSKNGAFFLLDAGTLAVLARRQLLPRAGGTGLPGDFGTAVAGVADTYPSYYENMYGVMGTATFHRSLGRMFVGLGGYAGIQGSTTPFLRALDWNTLADAWPTTLGAGNIRRYTNTTPPMYLTGEAGLSSPAVVNDLVFVSTSRAGLYALDVHSGFCKWTDPTLPALAPGRYCLGPAIYGNYVVIGAGSNVRIYSL